ncbi:hypothetical protein JRQ81_019372, partial [Phrynocephalus forsythii]
TIQYNSDSVRLFYQLLLDSDSPFGSTTFLKNLIGLVSDYLLSLNQKLVFQTIKIRILDIEFQESWNAANKTYSPLASHIHLKIGQLDDFLSLLKCPQNHKAFALPRCNVMPRALLE